MIYFSEKVYIKENFSRYPFSPQEDLWFFILCNKKAFLQLSKKKIEKTPPSHKTEKCKKRKHNFLQVFLLYLQFFLASLQKLDFVRMIRLIIEKLNILEILFAIWTSLTRILFFQIKLEEVGTFEILWKQIQFKKKYPSKAHYKILLGTNSLPQPTPTKIPTHSENLNPIYSERNCLLIVP